MADPGTIAIVMAGILAFERVFQLIFGRFKKSKCCGAMIVNESPVRTTALTPEAVTIGPVIGTGKNTVAV
jgi:hypothetical protein